MSERVLEAEDDPLLLGELGVEVGVRASDALSEAAAPVDGAPELVAYASGAGEPLLRLDGGVSLGGSGVEPILGVIKGVLEAQYDRLEVSASFVEGAESPALLTGMNDIAL